MDLNNIDFRIYYKNGETYSGPPEDAPIFDVLVIVERDKNHGRRLISDKDFYIWIDDRWRAVDYFGMIQYLKDPGWKRILLGVMADDQVWNATVKAAMQDPEFPAKTAYGINEVKGTR